MGFLGLGSLSVSLKLPPESPSLVLVGDFDFEKIFCTNFLPEWLILAKAELLSPEEDVKGVTPQLAVSTTGTPLLLSMLALFFFFCLLNVK